MMAPFPLSPPRGGRGGKTRDRGGKTRSCNLEELDGRDAVAADGGDAPPELGARRRPQELAQDRRSLDPQEEERLDGAKHVRLDEDGSEGLPLLQHLLPDSRRQRLQVDPD